MPGQVDGIASGKTLATPQVSPFKPGGELPDPLPPGAHRVISTMTAAQMRKMMEGVVLYGTGKQAQLNGYSSGGKTGTAQKIDPATHRYSKTMHVASFAGIAPVNNPVIAVAVIMDNPKGAYYGASVSAPVFAEVAQQVLEYLAVPHDIDLHRTRAADNSAAKVTEDDGEQTGDINALYAAANDLPTDDPLRGAPAQPVAASQPTATGKPQSNAQPVGAAANAGANPAIAPARTATTVIVADGKNLRVPSLTGLPVRKVIEQAAAAGFEVEITGSGTAREQAPVPGSMVAPGTRIVVKCGR
jgi:cell division protein FtsI (penicillin-binding protein 3)